MVDLTQTEFTDHTCAAARRLCRAHGPTASPRPSRYSSADRSRFLLMYIGQHLPVFGKHASGRLDHVAGLLEGRFNGEIVNSPDGWCLPRWVFPTQSSGNPCRRSWRCIHTLYGFQLRRCPRSFVLCHCHATQSCALRSSAVGLECTSIRYVELPCSKAGQDTFCELSGWLTVSVGGAEADKASSHWFGPSRSWPTPANCRRRCRRRRNCSIDTTIRRRRRWPDNRPGTIR